MIEKIISEIKKEFGEKPVHFCLGKNISENTVCRKVEQYENVDFKDDGYLL